MQEGSSVWRIKAGPSGYMETLLIRVIPQSLFNYKQTDEINNVCRKRKSKHVIVIMAGRQCLPTILRRNGSNWQYGVLFK